ncbi:MAG: repair protein radA protein [Parcubacteria group bacterium GW2011_GWB1_56_8]|nr:MAG: repair protein radA protein [Parcubacteria group bacterium GW2011_GWB1_56_8]
MAVYKCAGRKRLISDGSPACSYQSENRWIGRCPECGGWYDIDVFGVQVTKAKTTLASASTITEHYATGEKEFDLVLDGGLVKGQTILFGGMRGAGKTSFLIKLAALVASAKRPVIYASGEQNANDIGQFVSRIPGSSSEYVELMGNASEVRDITERAEEIGAFLTIYDSLQVMHAGESKGTEGSSAQGIAITNIVTSHCKRTKQCAILINHLSKAGEFAGSETVAHLVDTVIGFQFCFLENEDEETSKSFPKRFRLGGESYKKLRCMYSEKNRYGSTSYSGYWEMTKTGLVEVRRKSKLEIV